MEKGKTEAQHFKTVVQSFFILTRDGQVIGEDSIVHVISDSLPNAGRMMEASEIIRDKIPEMLKNKETEEQKPPSQNIPLEGKPHVH